MWAKIIQQRDFEDSVEEPEPLVDPVVDDTGHYGRVHGLAGMQW